MKGITVVLNVETASGTDPFGEATKTVEHINVNDVLVGEPSSDDVTNALALYGAKVAYKLALRKGDTHEWEGNTVTLPAPFEGTYHVVGAPTAGIEANIPLRWNKKVLIERIMEQ